LRGVGANPALTDICYLQLFNTGGVSWNEGIPSAPSQTAGMSLVFQDDFNGPLSISRTGAGTTYMSQKPDFQQFGMAAFEDYDSIHNPFAIVDGEYLRIRTQKAPAGYVDPMNWGRTYTSGILSAGHADGSAAGAATLGYFESRIAFGAGHVTWGAFWIMSQLGITGHYTYGTAEIDIMEAYGVYPDGPDYVHQVMHDWAPPGQTDVVHDDHMTKYSDFGINANLSQAFHVYAAKVTNTDTIFYIDDIEVWRTPTTERAKTAMYFILNNGLSHYWPIDLARYDYASDMFVDYVRVFE
jgi:beta-glucanase (GH16 family)